MKSIHNSCDASSEMHHITVKAKREVDSEVDYYRGFFLYNGIKHLYLPSLREAHGKVGHLRATPTCQEEVLYAGISQG